MQLQQQINQQKAQRYEQYFTTAQMRHYFYSPSLRYIWLILLGSFFSIIGIIIAISAAQYSSSYYNQYGTNPPSSPFASLPTYLIILGIVLLIWGIVPFLQYADRPTHAQYASWVAERSKPLYDIAKQRLHIHDESQCESIIEMQGGLSSFLQLSRKFPEKEIVVKRLPNGLRRSSINVSTYIFLTENDIAIYSGYINALAQNERFEDADRYYYTDIVGVSTSGPVYVSPYGPSGKESQKQGFFVRMNNGDVVGTDYATNVILRSGEKREKVEGVDKVVAALLYELRGHKVTAAEANRTSKDIA